MPTNEKLLILKSIYWLFISHKYLFSYGFCAFLRDLHYQGDINAFERIKFLSVLYECKPLHANDYAYWFPQGDYEVRLEFLESCINILKNDNGNK